VRKKIGEEEKVEFTCEGCSKLGRLLTRSIRGWEQDGDDGVKPRDSSGEKGLLGTDCAYQQEVTKGEEGSHNPRRKRG